ncbi:sulfatase-like hydrolase/transferase [Jiangella anatolica]|uniref:Arylsulfatase n=1 Tax=Jiangella anatolica TaxID=2670374 RepID=A0A2W2BYK3_9ACTN|nr:sulfatase-like hydrolase/transferase [Jiangella anatolica]PZF85574.1 arylsulfatase [Jiangella anatolica]
MTRRFNGTIDVDARDSTPDWAPYLQPVAPDGAPNVLYIVLDDVGFSAMEPWGGLIETPNIRRLAERGLTYTNWHTTALCSPTRSSLLTGRNHTTNGMACIAEATVGFPNGNGHIPFECATIAEVLGERGWNTYMLGKWHLCPSDEMNLASTKRNWPVGRGFERYYGFLGGETNQWYPDLVYDNHPVEQPALPEDGYHLTTDLTDRAIEFIRDAKMITPDKPFFMYFCPGATHAPHHAPREWIDRYRGRFDEGYEAYRERVFARQKELGIFPADAELSSLNPYVGERSPDGKPWPALDIVRPWAELPDEEKRLFCRMAEVYAGFLSHTDHEIGRLLDHLDETGEFDNTVIVLVSDNGASGEGGPNGSVNENKFFNDIPDDIEENLRYLDQLGSPSTYNHYPVGWAWAFNTPFKMWKRYNFEGGVADPLLVSWPAGIAAQGELRHQFLHATDIVPTIYDILGVDLPGTVKGYPQVPLEGVSFRSTFQSDDVPTPKESAFFSMLGSRAVWHKGWKAVTVHPTIAGWGHFDEDRWELYHTDVDPTETRDLAAEHPVKLQEMIGHWFHLAGMYHGLPLVDAMAVEVLADPTRPQVAPPRGKYVYYPGTAEVPESAAVNIRNRNYSIAVEVHVDSVDAQGVLFSHGARFGGHALYVKDGRLHYVYNYVGSNVQTVVGDAPVPTGDVVLSAAFVKDGDTMPTTGTVSLYIDDRQVGEGVVTTQPGNFSLVGEGLNVGSDPASPVTEDYPGTSPFAFTGGTIRAAIVDVSGEPFVDLEKEATAMMARE